MRDKNPYNRREEAVTKKAIKSVDKSVKPVAKDTNKTRRKVKKSDITGPIVKAVKPKAGSPVYRKGKNGD
jgi:hypothetical protein